MKTYAKTNAETIDRWISEGWQWGIPIDHQTYMRAKQGQWDMLLTPTKCVPKDWFLPFKGLKVLGLASGGGQQMPIFAALGAQVSVVDISKKQLESEKLVSQREGYDIEIICADITEGIPFEDESFDLVFHPVSNCYMENTDFIFSEAYRVLKKEGRLLSGLDNGINFIVDEDEKTIVHALPFNPLINQDQKEFLQKDDSGMQFSHTLEEQITGQLKAGFIIKDLYEDFNGEGRLHEMKIPTFFATLAIKK